MRARDRKKLCSSWLENESDTFEWRIARFDDLIQSQAIKPGKSVTTYRFTRYRWKFRGKNLAMTCFPKGMSDASSSRVSIFISLAGFGEEELENLPFDFSITAVNMRDSNKSVTRTATSHEPPPYKRRQENVRARYFGWPDFIALEDLVHASKGFMIQGQVTFVLKVWAADGCLQLLSEEEEDSDSPDDDRLYIHSFPEEYRDSFTDVTLVSSEGTEFQCHRLLLALRSKVFDAMLKTNMREKATGRIVISDCSTRSLDLLLKCIYDCQFGVQVTLKKAGHADLTHVFELAQKYEIRSLVRDCENAILQKINAETVVSWLVIAQANSSAKMLERCQHVIACKSKEIMRSEAWQDLLANPDKKMVNDALNLFVEVAHHPAKKPRLEGSASS